MSSNPQAIYSRINVLLGELPEIIGFLYPVNSLTKNVSKMFMLRGS